MLIVFKTLTFKCVNKLKQNYTPYLHLFLSHCQCKTIFMIIVMIIVCVLYGLQFKTGKYDHVNYCMQQTY